MMQPIIDVNGVYRFKPNEIVRRLLDDGGLDLNDIARWDVPQEDREQFAQLIGYSLGGYEELSYVSDDSCDVAWRMAREGEPEDLATVRVLMGKIVAVRQHVRNMAVELFNIHPDDLE